MNKEIKKKQGYKEKQRKWKSQFQTEFDKCNSIFIKPTDTY